MPGKARSTASIAAIAALGAAVSLPSATDQAVESRHRYTNRLANSDNPYLLLHAHNPVDWYPWGTEAFERARREDRPIFLSVGYSTCFWCHVAERTIYSDPAIADLMNQWFVNVKVDREQHPDVDQIYMLATRLITGHGGWPNNVFMTPELRPFFAGSYFPPADDPVRGTGFPAILRALHGAWTSERAKVLEAAEDVAAAMRRAQAQMGEATPAPVDPAAWLRAARESLLSRLDARHGGFGTAGGPKFPQSPDLALLLADARLNGHAGARAAVTGTLDALAFGGVHDHLAGGFHRYSTEPTWSVPHFEKMLYDNAQLLQLFAESYRLTANKLYRYVALETARYLMRDMTATTTAGFFTAQDAQIDGIEGLSYVWTRAEIAAELGQADAKRFFQVYELAPMPEQTAPGVKELPSRDGERPGVLRIRLPIERTLQESAFKDIATMLAALAPQRTRLLAARDQRRQPARDEKMLTGLNGLAIGAFARAGQVLKIPEFVTVAQMTANRIWSLAYDPKTRLLQHAIFRGRAQTDGYLQDYAQLGAAFMTLAEVTGDKDWRDRAALLADEMLRRFLREDGSFAMSADRERLLIPVTDEGDSEAPSGTSAAIELLLRLAALPAADPRYGEAALKAVGRLSGTLQRYPTAWATTITALNDYPVQSETFRIPVTADHVRVSAVAQTTADEDHVVVTIDVEKGYHINANPASFDYLIPTAVRFEQLRPSKLPYPKPVRFKPAFVEDGIDVYEGTVRLVASFPKGTLPVRGTIQGVVTAQACDDRICLPPSDLPFSVAAANR